jgi:hypothetical protein
MPELREVFEMTTKQVEPDLDSWRDQERRQRTRVRNRKIGAFVVVAAISVVAVVLILANRPGENGATTIPAGEPSATAPERVAPVGTVTFDGSTCSISITADRIEPGLVLFDAVNATDERVMFDSWQLLDGYTFRAFEARVERDRRLAEKGKGTWPSETKVRYLRSDVIPANTSGVIATTMSRGPHAITCLDRYEGQGFRPFGIAGPITVG